MLKTLNAILLPSDRVPDHLRQGVYITNILAPGFFVLVVVLYWVLHFMFGQTPLSNYVIGLSILFLCIIPINRKFYNAGRLLFAFIPVYVTLTLSIYGKIAEPYHFDVTYFDSRYVLLVTTILPGVIFRLDEKVKIIISEASVFFSLILFDPLHTFFGVGYFQLGFSSPTYYYINYITLMCYVILLFGMITMKVLIERAERLAKSSIEDLNNLNEKLRQSNTELTRLNDTLQDNREELVRQQEKIIESHELLEEANRVITEQQSEVVNANKQLERVVDEQSTNLIKTNQELARHNNELRQFSHTVSHNLRGPVARLLGLTSLINTNSTTNEVELIGKMIKKSGHELDEVLRDLSLIIDIRNDLYHVREKILLADEWRKTRAMLFDQIRPEFVIETSFSETPYVYSIRAMVQSILFNLISNAIKYRNPEKELVVNIKTRQLENENIVLEVIDNGLGFNVREHRENLFKLYKRFHTHVDGKGLGLFLIKTQLETLGGEIDIQSELNRGTVVTITFPTPTDVSKQVFFDSESAKIYYDAEINTTVIAWKKSITSMEYRKAFRAVLLTLKTYNTPGWIADLRLQGVVDPEDQIWFLETVIPEAIQCGLKRIATVGFTDPIRKDYYSRMAASAAEFDIQLKVFYSVEEANEWMQGFTHSGIRSKNKVN